MKLEEIWLATIGNEHIGVLSNYILHGWPSKKAEVKKETQPFWSLRDGIVVMDGIAMKTKE